MNPVEEPKDPASGAPHGYESRNGSDKHHPSNKEEALGGGGTLDGRPLYTGENGPVP